MKSPKIKVGVVGVGRFGRHHARVYKELPEAELVGVVDVDDGRASEVAAEFQCRKFSALDDLIGQVDAVSIAVPTDRHAEVGRKLIDAGIDVLIEKPLARTVAEADELITAAEGRGRILQAGHLERFNPGVRAARAIVSSPLFFEVHRLSLFSPRSLEVDVILDLMIHDLDIVLSLVDSEPEEIRGVGLAVLTPKIDIANVRLQFRNACVANFTASRVSFEKVRKLRWFQPHEYISVDYTRQEASATKVDFADGEPLLSYRKLETASGEPLQLQLMNFLGNVRERKSPEMDGRQARRALQLAHQILEEITRHSDRLRMRAGIDSHPNLFETRSRAPVI